MHIVYILASISSPSKYYIGITQNLEKRLAEHNSGLSYYSKRHVPWRVETCVSFNDKNLAEVFEKYLKVGSGNAFLKRRLIPPLWAK